MFGRQLLVAAQVAFCLIALVGAGLILRTVYNLQSIDLGFDSERLLLVSLDTRSRVATANQDLTFYRNLVNEIRRLPRVENASLAFTTPFGGMRMANDVFNAEGTKFNVDMNAVDVNYFGTMGIPLLSGRDFREQDREGSPGVAIVNQAMARRLWSDAADVLGQSVRLWDPNGPGSLVEVIGVVGNGRYHRSWRDSSKPFMFFPVAQQYMAGLSLHIRTRTQDDSGSSVASVRQILERLEPNLEIDRVAFAEKARSEAIVLERMGAKLLSSFSILALTLAALGIYGVVSFSVSQRTHEIGIRIALGAGKREIVRLFVGQSSIPLLLGAAVGWAGAFSLSRSIAGLLYGVATSDLSTYGAVTLVLIGTGLVAAYVPSRRATRVDPLVAIRCE